MTATLDSTIATREFKLVQRMIYDQAGIALADSKQIMVHSRLAKRLRELNITNYAEYLDMLQKDPDSDEMIRFINALTTNKTDFFREKHHFQFLTQQLFPKLKAAAEVNGKRKLRIWCSASSTGEEPYSLAITARQFFGSNSDWDIRILASDIDTQVLTTASNGVYSSDRFADVPSAVQKQYFDRCSRGEDCDWSAKPTLRELITFRRINLQQDWPVHTQFDVIFCRNVMIYFDAATQKRLVERFREKLTDKGYLVIGHSESLFGLSDQFKPIGETIYQKTDMTVKEGRTATSTANVNNKAVEPIRVTRNPSPVLDSAVKSNVQKSIAPRVGIPSMTSLECSDPKFPIIVGEIRASDRPEWITTLLGSCVATCLYDEVAKIAGMNHFMLPNSVANPRQCASFGVHAMELLINRIMKLGGNRSRLKAKVFGGSAVVNTSDKWNVGAKNIEFAKRFLDVEGIPIVASHTGGTAGMQIQFHTRSMKVLVRELDQATVQSVLEQERHRALAFRTDLSKPQDITLF
jgi:chemotaxis protein methyltransferase CheR